MKRPCLPSQDLQHRGHRVVSGTEREKSLKEGSPNLVRIRGADPTQTLPAKGKEKTRNSECIPDAEGQGARKRRCRGPWGPLGVTVAPWAPLGVAVTPWGPLGVAVVPWELLGPPSLPGIPWELQWPLGVPRELQWPLGVPWECSGPLGSLGSCSGPPPGVPWELLAGPPPRGPLGVSVAPPPWGPLGVCRDPLRSLGYCCGPLGPLGVAVATPPPGSFRTKQETPREHVVTTVHSSSTTQA